MTVSDRAAAIWIGVIAAAIYVAAGIGLSTDYDYYGRLADAFLHGRWWLTEAPSWLNELLPCGAGRYCVVYPPLPAILSLPFVPLFPTAVAQVIAARIAGGASAGALYYAIRAYGAPRTYALAGALLSAFGTTLFFSSVDGRAWYAAHSASMLFLALAFAVAARGGSAFVVGALVGISALARLPVAFAAPALALLCARRTGTPYGRSLAGVIAGGLPLAIVYVGYNLLRWGTPFDDGYTRLIQGDVFFNHGLFSPLYLPRQLYAIFLQDPEIVPDTPFFLRPRFIGMSLFITTPSSGSSSRCARSAETSPSSPQARRRCSRSCPISSTAPWASSSLGTASESTRNRSWSRSRLPATVSSAAYGGAGRRSFSSSRSSFRSP